MGTKRAVGKGGSEVGMPTPKGSLAPLFLEPSLTPQAPSWHRPRRAGGPPEEGEGELWGSETRWDSRMARPTCRVGWPPTPSLSDKSCWVAVWARCPRRGKHFIKLKCFCNGRGAETRGQCGIRGHHARFPLLDCPTLQSCRPKGILCPQNLAPNSTHTPPLSVCSSLWPHLSGAPGLCP